jgi:SHS2 domain-containing protein
VTASHRFFDHTGDFGVELHADTREALYAEAGRAWLDLLTDQPELVREREERAIEVEGFDPVDLLVGLGNELLYLFEAREWLAARIEVEVLEDGLLQATAFGEPFDPMHHTIARPVKAVTQHGAEVLQDETGWCGRLIYDL